MVELLLFEIEMPRHRMQTRWWCWAVTGSYLFAFPTKRTDPMIFFSSIIAKVR